METRVQSSEGGQRSLLFSLSHVVWIWKSILTCSIGCPQGGSVGVWAAGGGGGRRVTCESFDTWSEMIVLLASGGHGTQTGLFGFSSPVCHIYRA